MSYPFDFQIKQTQSKKENFKTNVKNDRFRTVMEYYIYKYREQRNLLENEIATKRYASDLIMKMWKFDYKSITKPMNSNMKISKKDGPKR